MKVQLVEADWLVSQRVPKVPGTIVSGTKVPG